MTTTASTTFQDTIIRALTNAGSTGQISVVRCGRCYAVLHTGTCAARRTFTVVGCEDDYDGPSTLAVLQGGPEILNVNHYQDAWVEQVEAASSQEAEQQALAARQSREG